MQYEKRMGFYNMFMKNGKRKRIKICSSLFLLFITVITICSGCESYSMYSGDRLAENFENYKSIFEEYDVEIKIKDKESALVYLDYEGTGRRSMGRNIRDLCAAGLFRDAAQ